MRARAATSASGSQAVKVASDAADVAAAHQTAPTTPGTRGTKEQTGGDGQKLTDTNKACTAWAAKGECERNRAYMQKACPAACAAVNGRAAAAPAHDEL